MEELYLAVNENGEFREFNAIPKRTIHFATLKGIWTIENSFNCEGVLVNKNDLPEEYQSMTWENEPIKY